MDDKNKWTNDDTRTALKLAWDEIEKLKSLNHSGNGWANDKDMENSWWGGKNNVDKEYNNEEFLTFPQWLSSYKKTHPNGSK